MSAGGEQTAQCISGLVGLYINHFGSLEPALRLCNQLEKSNKQVCEDVVGFSSKLFQN